MEGGIRLGCLGRGFSIARMHLEPLFGGDKHVLTDQDSCTPLLIVGCYLGEFHSI